MFRVTANVAIFIGALSMGACGGNDDPGPPDAVPLPAQQAQLGLDATNYQFAVSHALTTANLAFGFARMGAQLANAAFNNSVAFPRLMGCREGGSVSVELTDRNRNGSLNANDTMHLFMDRCTSNGVPLSGVVRVEVVSATPLANGREFVLNVEFVNVQMAPPGADAVTVNFVGAVQFSTGADFDHYVVTFGEFRQQQAGETRSMTELVVDYLQRYDTRTYDYLLQGRITGGAAGEYRLTTPAPFTGSIGAYPEAGRLALSGASNSTARLAEEGVAVANVATVLVSVDVNGDGTADAAVPELAWDRMLPPDTFGSLRDTAGATLLPLP